MSFAVLMRKPAAWVPLAMSAAALALALGAVTFFGAGREQDEGAAAHLFQLLIAAQLPVIAWFAVKWLPQRARPALSIIAFQLLGMLAALTAVYGFGL